MSITIIPTVLIVTGAVVSPGENAAKDGEEDEKKVEGIGVLFNAGGLGNLNGDGREKRRDGEEQEKQCDGGQENDENRWGEKRRRRLTTTAMNGGGGQLWP